MTIRIFEINDCDWWAGDCTPEEILAAYLEETGCTHEEATGDISVFPAELSEQALDRLTFVREDPEGDTKVTFREELQAMVSRGATFPCSFASTEW